MTDPLGYSSLNAAVSLDCRRICNVNRRAAKDDNYLDREKLFVSKPKAGGNGRWIELSMTSPVIARVTKYRFADNADVALVNASSLTNNQDLASPADCEITGCCETPDGKTLFINIQHPGEAITKANITDPTKYLSHWPANAGYGAGGATTARPRSATIVITKNDGGLIGS